MATQGPNFPGTQADDASFGATTWVNVTNAATDNGSAVGTVSGISTNTQYLKLTGYGFAIPAGATINGILVEIKRARSTGTSVNDARVRLVRAGTVETTDKASATIWPGSSAFAYASYGNSTDLWGATWTATDINNASFGMVVAAQKVSGKQNGAPLVDTVRITITYTAAASGSLPLPVIVQQSVNRAATF